MEQMQPSPAERQQWEPLIKAVSMEVADSFSWSGTNGTVQSYRHETTHHYLHIDGASGQFYDRDKNPISREAALDRALPQETLQYGGPSQSFDRGTQNGDAENAFAIS